MMKTEFKDVNSFTKSVQIHLDSKQYTNTYQKTLSKLAKKVSIPGFRKGKVPPQIIEKNYADSVKSDTLDKLIQDSFRKACEEAKIQPLGNVKVEDLNLSDSNELDFRVEFEVKPEIKKVSYKNLKIRKDIRKVDPKEIEITLQNIQLQNSKVLEIPADAEIKKGSFVKMDVQELDEELKAKPNHVYKDMELCIGDGHFDKKIEADLVGLKVNEKKQVTRKYPKNHKDKTLAGKSEHYEVLITHLEEREIPELTDELVSNMNKDSDIKTVDQLKDAIQKNLESRYENESANAFVRNVAETIVKKNPFDIPESMINTYLDRLYQHQNSQQAVNEEKFKQARRDTAIDEIKWELIKEFIMEEEDIKINDENHDHKEVLEYIDSLAYSDQEKEYIKSNHNMIHDFEYQLLTKKLMDKIEEWNKIDEHVIKLDQ